MELAEEVKARFNKTWAPHWHVVIQVDSTREAPTSTGGSLLKAEGK